MIQLTGASKRFGPKILFEELDWLVTPGERTGLVGANGTGKSTLLKILAGIDSLDGGSKTVMKGVTFGYLPQDGLSLSGRSVFAECMTVFAGLRAWTWNVDGALPTCSITNPRSKRTRSSSTLMPASPKSSRARSWRKSMPISSRIVIACSWITSTSSPERMSYRLSVLRHIPPP